MAIPPSAGYTGHAVLVPATIANAVPSGRTSIAAVTAWRAEEILVAGTSIEPEQSTMMISAEPEPEPVLEPPDPPAGAEAPVPTSSPAVTVTIALTVLPPSGR